jgi:DNA polymerase-3 subunit epsilon
LSFTAIDFETANPQRASVCAVGVVKVRDGVVVDSLSTLVQPPPGHETFAPMNVGVHGIRPRDVVGAPTWDEVYPAVAALAGPDVLVAHNASFDRSVLTRANQAVGLPVPSSTWLCTRDTAKDVLDLPSYRLPDVSRALGLAPHAHHDAAADARQCALVLVALHRRRGPAGPSLVTQRARSW